MNLPCAVAPPYATLLIDLERHRPVDVVEDRKAAPVAQWLAAHPGTEVLARDRAEAYALAGRTAAPHALQVADRFHLVCNVNEALKELVRSRRWCLPKGEACPSPPVEPALPPIAIRVRTPEPQPTPTKRQLWEVVQKRREKGQSIKGIARELGMDHRTVRRYLALDRPPVYGPRRPRLPSSHPTSPILRSDGGKDTTPCSSSMANSSSSAIMDPGDGSMLPSTPGAQHRLLHHQSPPCPSTGCYCVRPSS